MNIITYITPTVTGFNLLRKWLTVRHAAEKRRSVGNLGSTKVLAKLIKDEGGAGEAFTTDAWSDLRVRGFIGTTIHFITGPPALERINLTLGLELLTDRHTAEAIAGSIKKIRTIRFNGEIAGILEYRI